MQAAAAHAAFISETTFSSPANVTTVQYVNGSTLLVYSSAFDEGLIQDPYYAANYHSGIPCLVAVPSCCDTCITPLSSGVAPALHGQCS